MPVNVISPSALYAMADAAGKRAADAFVPVPMVVEQRENGFDLSSKLLYREVVADGPCGFAWINVPGNSAFGRYAKSVGHNKGYPRGISIWVSAYGQSMMRKEAYARAFAEVLRAHGVERAYAASRMD